MSRIGKMPITLPAGVTVAPGQYLSVARSAAGFRTLYGMDADVAGLTLGLGNSGDVISLHGPAGEADRVAWENFEAGWSIGAGTGFGLCARCDRVAGR